MTFIRQVKIFNAEWRFSSSLGNFPQLKIGLEGAYQQENAALALQAFLLFMREGKEVVDEQVVRQGLETDSLGWAFGAYLSSDLLGRCS